MRRLCWTFFSEHIELPAKLLDYLFRSNKATSINLAVAVADKIGEKTKLEILVLNKLFWSIVGARPIAASRIGGTDNEAGMIMSIWGPSLPGPHILQIHSLHQVATGNPSHVPLWRRKIIIAIFCGFGTNCMVPSDLSPKCVCGPNYTSYVIGESSILSFFVSLFVFIKPENPYFENPYFASRFRFEVKFLGVYPLRPRSSSCGSSKRERPPRTTLRANWD